MGVAQNQTYQRKVVPCVVYTLILIALLQYYSYINPFYCTKPLISTTISNSVNVTPSQGQATELDDLPWCDYSDGQWVQTTVGPLYNGTSCESIKWAQNCMVNGRPDTGYLYWQWQPKDSRCPAPVFDASLFLENIKNKHIAFIGDSVARNQVESLMCLLSVASKPHLVYQDSKEPKFRRWVINEYNATISVFWSPFLVEGIEKEDSKDGYHNTLYLDTPNEKWASELDKLDMVVFSVGHWFVQSAIYYGAGDQLIGCNSLHKNNCTDFSFFNAFRKVIQTTLKEVMTRFQGSNKAVIMATFTSSHFEGEWDKFGACPKTEPYKEGEKEIPYLEVELRKVVIEEVAMAVNKVKEMKGRLNIEALDLTKLALLRPDGHPGAYMYPNPFANGIKDKVQNDCLHWCLPGPIDTWNAIMLHTINKWKYVGAR